MSSKIRFVVVEAELAAGELAHVAETLNQALRHQSGATPALPLDPLPDAPVALPAPVAVPDDPPPPRAARVRKRGRVTRKRSAAKAPVADAGTKRRGKYSAEQLTEAERLVTTTTDTLAAIAERTGVPSATLGYHIHKPRGWTRPPGTLSDRKTPAAAKGAAVSKRKQTRKKIKTQKCPLCEKWTSLNPCEMCHTVIAPGALVA